MPIQNQNKKISEFSLATSLTDGDVMPIVNGGQTKKLTLSGLTSFVNQNLSVSNIITGGTYSNTTGIITFTNVTGGTFNVSGFFRPADDVYINQLDFNNSNYELTVYRNDGWSETQSLSILATSMTVTGGTYNANTGIVTFVDNSGGTFSVSGFTSGLTDTVITGFTYAPSANTFTITDSRLSSFTTTFNSVSGLTVNGTLSATTINGGISNINTISSSNITSTSISATTVSATTFYGDGSNLTNITLSVSANTGIEKSNNILYTIYNSTLDENIQMTSSVGGLSAGTTVSLLTGKTIVQLFDSILFPTVNPTYTIPTITLTGVTTQTLQVGTTYTTNIGLYGTKNDAGGFSQLRILKNASVIFTDNTLGTATTTNIASQFGYSSPNNPNYLYLITPFTYSESYVIPAPTVGNTSSTTTYYGDGTYGAGLPKQDSKGNTDVRAAVVRSVNAPQASGTSFQTSTYTITGIYPYFYGTSATLPTPQSIADSISAGTASLVLASASGTVSIPYNINSRYIWMAHFEGYTSKTKWYVSALDNGNIDGSFIISYFSQPVNSPNSYWTGINYKMYWSVNETIQTTLEYRNS